MAATSQHPKGKRTRRSRTSARMLAGSETESKAFDLRIQGFSWFEIAEKIGCTESAAYKAVVRRLERSAKDSAETIEQVRAIEVGRYDKWLTKLQPGIDEGDPGTIAVAMKVSERRAKILGLDAPEKHEVVTIAALQRLPQWSQIVSLFWRLVPPERHAELEASLAAIDRGEVPALPEAIVVESRPVPDTEPGGSDGEGSSDI